MGFKLCSQWRIQGPKGRKNLFLRPPPPPSLSQGLDDWAPPHLKAWIRRWFKLYQIALAPTREPYRSGLLFTHKNDDFTSKR